MGLYQKYSSASGTPAYYTSIHIFKKEKKNQQVFTYDIMLTNDGDLNKENCVKTFLNRFKTSWFSITSAAVNFSEGPLGAR